MDFSALIMQIDNILWATPLIILTFGLALVYCFAIKFGNVTQFKLQWKLLTKGEGSEEGLSAFETFCSVAAYRVAVGNIGGVMVAIMYGGPGAVVWMIIAVLLFMVISGGVRRIAKFSTIIVPFMTIGYLIITIIVLITHASNIGPTLAMMFSSAFGGGHAIFGGMLGAAFSYGVKRAVNSSGSGFGETPPSAAAAETPHPANQGLVNAFSVYIDVAVCACSGIMALVTDCFNVLNTDGTTFKYIGAGSAQMQAQADSMTAGVVWVQEAANTALPVIGGIIIAIALTCFAYSTCIAYYYEGESGLAYLTRKANDKTRKTLIWGIRIIMPIFFFIWSNVTASTAWAISEIMFAIMSWLNLLTLIFLLPNVKKIYDDFFQQLKAGIEVPYFNPKKLGIKNVDLWMDINKDLIAEGKAEAIYEKK